MHTRREFLKLSAMAGAGLLAPWRVDVLRQLSAGRIPRAFPLAIPGDILDPTSIPQFEDPLVIPPVMPPVGRGKRFTLDHNLYRMSLTLGGDVATATL